MSADTTTQKEPENKGDDGLYHDPDGSYPRRSGNMPYEDYAREKRIEHGYWPMQDPYPDYDFSSRRP